MKYRILLHKFSRTKTCFKAEVKLNHRKNWARFSGSRNDIILRATHKSLESGQSHCATSTDEMLHFFEVMNHIANYSSRIVKLKESPFPYYP
jgi:hypothetical protein